MRLITYLLLFLSFSVQATEIIEIDFDSSSIKIHEIEFDDSEAIIFTVDGDGNSKLSTIEVINENN